MNQYLETRLGIGACAVPALLTAALMAAGPLTLEPVDEGPQRPDFLTFRRELQKVVADRDVDALLGVVHPKIKNTFGDDNGIEAFKQIWRLDRPDCELWRELGEVLRLGGTFDGPDSFIAPYVFSRWPENFDAFEYVAVIGSNVRVRSSRDSQARILTTASYSILGLGGDKGYPQRPWTAVNLPDGRSGFVAAHLVRSPIDYRAYFVRSDRRWRMTMFIAGD